jgi:hypothetical protein
MTADSINSSPKVTLLVAFLGGCCFGFFSTTHLTLQKEHRYLFLLPIFGSVWRS